MFDRYIYIYTYTRPYVRWYICRYIFRERQSEREPEDLVERWSAGIYRYLYGILYYIHWARQTCPSDLIRLPSKPAITHESRTIGIICTRSQIIATHNHVCYLNIMFVHKTVRRIRTLRGTNEKGYHGHKAQWLLFHCFTTSRPYITFTDELYGSRKTIYDFVKKKSLKNNVYTDTCARSLSSSSRVVIRRYNTLQWFIHNTHNVVNWYKICRIITSCSTSAILIYCTIFECIRLYYNMRDCD